MLGCFSSRSGNPCRQGVPFPEVPDQANQFRYYETYSRVIDCLTGTVAGSSAFVPMFALEAFQSFFKFFKTEN